MNINGTINNSGSTLSWGSQGVWTLNGGTISGGAINVTPGQTINVINGTLNNVPIPSAANVNIATNGALVLSGSWTNLGNISGGGSLVLEGSFSPSAIGNVNLPNGVVYLDGSLNIGSGNSYQLTSPWELGGGSIFGGTLVGTSNAPLGIYYGGTLNGVNLNTPNISTDESPSDSADGS